MIPESLLKLGPLESIDGTPLYQAAHDRVALMIKSGKLAPETRLPSERIFAELLGISRMTARHVYDSLEKEGLVYRMDRRGWYVARHDVMYGLTNSVSFIENVRSKGSEGLSEVLEISVRKPSDIVSRKLQLAQTENVYVLRRVFRVDGAPTMVETLYAQQSRFPRMEDYPLEQSLTPIWREHYGVKIARSEVELQTRRYLASEAKVLEAAENDFGIHVCHLYFTQENTPVGYDLQTWRADGVVFSLNLHYD